MTLETKGTIKYDPNVKPGDPEYIIQVKQLGIVATGSGDIVQMMNELTERTRREMSEQFGIPRCDVVMVKYSMSCTFDISAPVNCTLEEFGIEPVRENVIALKKKIEAYAERTGQNPEAVLDKLEKERDNQQQSILDKVADAVNAGVLDTSECTVTASTRGGIVNESQLRRVIS